MLEIVSAMFANAPVLNPDGSRGINIVHDYGQGGQFGGGNHVPDDDGVIVGTVLSPEYDAIFGANFNANRLGYFHYVLMPHRYITGSITNSSGYAEISGPLVDEIIVSLYCYATTTNVAYTIAHELGHNLRLLHGGNTNCNYKPNYPSLMNYDFQFRGIPSTCSELEFGLGQPNFSSGVLSSLDELALNEAAGVCGTGRDWNMNGQIDPSLVASNINPGSANWECGGSHTVLTDHDDWRGMFIPIRTPQNGGGSEPEEGVLCDSTPPELK